MKITRGKVKEPYNIVLAGVPGVGKSSLGADAPNSISIDAESGTKQIAKANRFEGINTTEDVMSAIKWLKDEKHDYQTVVIDSIDAIESFIWKTVCRQYKVDTIEDVGYGKGYTAAIDYHLKIIESLKDLRKTRNMNTISIAHTKKVVVNDLVHAMPYEQHTLKLNDKAAAKWREMADAVLFATYEDVVYKQNPNDKRGQLSVTGNRKIYTTRHQAFDAKNRYGLPPSLSLSWDALSGAIELGEPDSKEVVHADLKDLVSLLAAKDKTTCEKMITAVEAAGDDLSKLINIRNHARVLAKE